MDTGETPSAPRGFRSRAALLVGSVLLASLGVGGFYLSEQAKLRDWSRKTETVTPLPPNRVGFMVPGVVTPPMRPPAEAGLPDDAPVIGVVAGGQARAYALSSMGAPTRHIVNDVVGGLPVTVTYCDLSDCTRAFAVPGKADPLDISQAGTFGDEMLVKIGHVTYKQATGEVYEPDPGYPAVPFPYPEYPLVRTTWGEWKARHPGTAIYVYRDGDPNPRPGDPLLGSSAPIPISPGGR
ncbi:DUF3179 domain-containing (seleno)protein [Tundrisphaera sp. TA3]|uniref:DUF3179 domain-containing (seleno)protein n=1 Tax=Tundrisphaera sp. TA3 TaxID=3435775 RepID=UPI003EB83CD8